MKVQHFYGISELAFILLNIGERGSNKMHGKELQPLKYIFIKPV